MATWSPNFACNVSILRWPSNSYCGISGRKQQVRCSKGDTQADERLLEGELREAVMAENYGKAASLRGKLRLIQEDNISAVLAANTRFYKAFEEGDLASMRKIWGDGENVHCIHPGAGGISGKELVMASWELMLGPELELPLKIELHNVQVDVKGDMGFVNCIEIVRTGGSRWGKQVATNIFSKQKDEWYISLHHASTM